MNDLHDQYTVTCEELEDTSLDYKLLAEDLKEYKEWKARQDSLSDDMYGIGRVRDEE
jgi:hypothetical protein